MNRLYSLLLFSVFFIGLNAQVVIVGGSSSAKKSGKDQSAFLHSMIKDATWKRDVIGAYIIPIDKNGNPRDSIKAGGRRWNGFDVIETSSFNLPVAVGDTVAVFEVGAEGYETDTIRWTFKPIGKREQYRQMDPVFLVKKHMLSEVTVTASKVKFYNKGDTIVYDASAFLVAEGSMLDALISQLPGAKIDENGRITVNGEFVESLLLNGKDMFKDDHSVMLENLPAYTVKNIEVYKGHTKEEKREGMDNTAPQHLTMDVKLKKEYNNGWIINSQAGYGTENRYLARLFASWFSPTTSVILTGLSNNLNDNRTPGKNDSWTPEQMPSGRLTTHIGSIRYSHNSVDEKVEASGNITVSGGTQDNRTSVSATNFLTGGDTYERRFNNQKVTKFNFATWHDFYLRFNNGNRFSNWLRGDYAWTKNRGEGLSAAFNSDYSGISQQALEAIYGNNADEALKSLINRSATLNSDKLTSGNISINPHFSFKLPGTSDMINLGSNVEYTTSKRHAWNDYNINFGSDPQPAERRRQYIDESPNHKFETSGRIGYSHPMKSARLQLNYEYTFIDASKDSYMYALERLQDMGEFGVLPADYASTLDPKNSYTSRTLTNRHMLNMYYSNNWTFDKSAFFFMVNAALSLKHQHFDYWRDNRNYLVKRTTVNLHDRYYTIYANYSFTKQESNDQYSRYTNNLQYRLSIYNRPADIFQMVDVVNDADPLNIQEGNPNLHNELCQLHSLSWMYKPQSQPINNRLIVTYNMTSNALVRGYIYDTSTGVRHFRTYNVDGNYTFETENFFNWNFGCKKQFSLASASSFSTSNSVDMVGINQELPSKVKVRNLWLGEDLILSYKLGKQELKVQGTVSHRKTTSARPDFNDIDAQHYKYGIGGVFNLPAGFGISTDLYCYKRVGYGVRELDTTDAIWNMRLTYTPPGSRWVFTADGFDLLHKLSNVNYAVTATGRTVTYSNTLPRYFIFTVQYRLNIQPKK